MYEFTSDYRFYSAETTESLTSWTADTINALAHGWNSAGDDAQASILVTSPADDKAELDDYSNHAFAWVSPQGTWANADQRCYWANVEDYSKGRIFTSLYGKEGGNDWSKVTLNLPWGTLNNPYPSSPWYTAEASGSTVDYSNGDPMNPIQHRTYAKQSTNAYGLAYSSPTGYYFAQATAHRLGYNDIIDNDYFATGTHTINQYASTARPSASAYNTHYV
jgi:hypothetical protein